MSVNIGSQQLSLTDRTSAQMEPSSNSQSNIPASLVAQQLSSTNKQSVQVDTLPSIESNVPVSFGSQPLSSSVMYQGLARGQSPRPVNLGAYPLQSLPMLPQSNFQTSMSAFMGLQEQSPTIRRPSGVQPSLKVETSMPVNVGSKLSPSTNKRSSPMGASPKVRTTMLISPVQQQKSSNKRPHMEPPSNAKTESFESVRSKLRESLTSALGTVTQVQDKLQPVEKTSPSNITNAQKQTDVVVPSDEMFSVTSHAPSQETPSETSTPDKQSQKQSEGHVLTDDSSRKENASDTGPTDNTSDETKALKSDLQEYQIMNHSSDDELPFSGISTIKDEFLRGHGLCWAPEVDIEYSEDLQNHSAKKPKLDSEEITENTKDITLLNAEKLATEIEAEMFKYFGGVNKKYKEKGRSLLFNLKDRNNPELRERVLSGDITPERLCSMTAEELASRELSEWRIAKAEELAHMVVLQESGVDIRRLVRKTHKGEFQVDFEQDDNTSAEVGLAADVLSQASSKSNEEVQAQKKSNDGGHTSSMTIETKAPERLQTVKDALGDQNLSGNLDARLHERNDLIQDFMVDEPKETEFLPPVVSLDEFMEDLDKEPPFGNLLVDVEGDVPSAEKSSNTLDPEIKHASNILDSEMNHVPDRLDPMSHSAQESPGSKADYSQDTLVTKPLNAVLESSVDTSSYNISRIYEKYDMPESNLKSRTYHGQPNTSPANVSSKSEYIWEGEMQLNVSALATVNGLFRSGEETSTREWPAFLEIKGRVRLEAFEKFLQQLPLSRSRAIMITQFNWKEGSSVDGRVHIYEAVNSYVTDERVGFAEPAPGVELYLCPPHPKTIEMLGRHLPKEHMDGLQSAVDGLIGVVVWRRPVSVSQHKHKKHSSSRKHHDNNVNLTPRASVPRTPPSSIHTNPKPPPENEPLDDIPPGFGPKDDDDLPEFDFVSSKKQGPVPPQVPAMSQMRELIHKYGQINNARKSTIKMQSWNDDDDIPEWQPEQDIQPQTQRPLLPAMPPPPVQSHGYPQQQQYTQQLILNQNFQPMQPPQQQTLQAPPQQFVTYSMPMQMPMPMPMSVPMPMQPQMGLVPGQQNVHPGWQNATLLPQYQGPPNVGLPLQPSQYPAQHGLLAPVQNVMVWRPDNTGGFR